MFSDHQQKMNRIAIIGSGITGISVAFQHSLTTNITMFDKSRRPGGRVCTRTSRLHPGYSFDHGTPFVYPKGQFLTLLQKINAIKQVSVKFCQNVNSVNKETVQKKFFGGNPEIETIPLRLIQELKKKTKLSLQFNTKITSIDSLTQNGQFILSSESNKKYGPFDKVYVCIPYPQCETLKQNCVQFPKINGQSYHCCWVVLTAFDKNSEITKKFGKYDIIKDIGEDIQSMVSQKQKGNTSDDDLWVFTMGNQWCQKNKDLKPEAIEEIFKEKLRKVINNQIGFKFIKAHRWLYAKPRQNPHKPIQGKNIIFGGDWVGSKENVQQSWDLGPLLYAAINGNHPNL